MSQPKDIDWPGICKRVHVCTSTYHISLLDPLPKLYVIILYC